MKFLENKRNILYIIPSIIILGVLVWVYQSKNISNEDMFDKTQYQPVIAEGNVNYETFIKSQNSDYSERVFYTISNEQDWNELMDKAISQTNIPAIDFTKEMLIVAFQGKKPTGGYSIEISNLKKKDGIIGVTIVESEHGSDCITAQVITSPFHIVKISKTSDKFEYILTKKTVSCGR